MNLKFQNYLIIKVMKTKLLILSFLFIPLVCLTAQIPQGFNYQAIARDVSGNPIINYALPVRVTIQSDSLGGTVFWTELHSAVSTNSFGLFSLVVGKGARQSGTAVIFSDIDWSVTPKFLKTEINYSGWKNMGTSRLLSVPYAMAAKDISGSLSRLSVTGKTTNPDEALFEVKNQTGQTVFAVYSEGVRIYVDDGNAKGVKGGFAIGGFGSAKAPSQNLFVVSPDSIRAYIGTNPLKGVKGGFAIGGFDAAKALPEEYLRVTRDSTRVYVNQAPKGVKGGFAIGGLTPAKGPVENFVNLTPNNYFIGHNAGSHITSGIYNNFIGFESGLSTTTGSNNSFIGYQAGKANLSGIANTFIGNSAGSGNLSGSSNTFVGTLAGQNFSSGGGNTFMGVQAGFNFLNGNFNVFIGSLAGAGYQFPVGITGGQHNVAVGTGAGYRLTTGNNNVFLGNFAGVFNTSGGNNVFMGFQSGWQNSTGNYNSFIGYQSGMYNTTGVNNVFMGYQAGFLNSIGYNNIFLGNNSGNSNTEGYYNTFIGNSAGYSNTTGIMNVFVGNEAGISNTTASRNVFIGPLTGRYNTIGEANVFIGQQAGEANTSGSFNLFAGRAAGNFNTSGLMNTFLGINAGNANTTGQQNLNVGGESGKWNGTGSYNVNVGTGAGFYNGSGDMNTMLGYYTGISLTSGSNNIFIGPYAGGGISSTSGKLFIENSSANENNALIYGDFSTDFLRLNANVEIRNSISFPNSGAVLWVGAREALWFNGTYYSWGFGGDYNYFAKPVAINTTVNPGTYKLYIAGNVAVTGTVTNPSDARYKTNITELTGVLPDLIRIRSVSYDWDNNRFPEMKFGSGIQLGFIAQEVEPLFPELVVTDSNGYKSLDYSKMTVLLLQAVKEQQQQIEISNMENTQLRSELRSLKEDMDRIKSLLSAAGLK